MRIKKVDYLDNYKLKIVFSDNSIKLVDLEHFVKKAGGIFLPLRELNFFKQVALDDCHLSIFWPNGADICPDMLYEMGTEFKKTAKKPIKKVKTVKKLIPRKKRKQIA